MKAGDRGPGVVGRIHLIAVTLRICSIAPGINRVDFFEHFSLHFHCMQNNIYFVFNRSITRIFAANLIGYLYDFILSL